MFIFKIYQFSKYEYLLNDFSALSVIIDVDKSSLLEKFDFVIILTERFSFTSKPSNELQY